MNVDMAKRLADRRRQAGLTQEALAEKLEVSRQAVSKWERSESSPDTDNLIALAQLYGVSLDELLYQDADAYATESETAKDSGTSAGTANTSGRGETSFEEKAWQAEGAGEVAFAAPYDRRSPGLEGEQAASAAGAASKSDASGTAGMASATEGTPKGAACGADEAAASQSEGVCGEEGCCAEGETVAEGDCGGARRRNHVGFDGIHVEDGGDYVHINWRDGVNVLDREGNSVHVNWDGVHVNDRDYDDLHRANEALGAQMRPHGPQTSFGRAWACFPFPAAIILAYILVGVFQNQWGMGLFLFAAIPLYYLVGALIDSKRLGPFLAGLYPLAVVVVFCYLAFVQNMAHPAWVLFLTIPLAEWIIVSLSHWWQHRRQPHPCDETA